MTVLEPRAWAEVCKVIEDPETVLAELRSRQGAITALDEEIERLQTTIKTLDRRSNALCVCSLSAKPTTPT